MLLSEVDLHLPEMKNFLKIAVTSPDTVEEETAKINLLLEEKAIDFVHLRKPTASEDEMRELLSRINPALLCRITLHSHFKLANEFPIGGLHINHRSPDIPSGNHRLSKSCHSLEELEDPANHSLDYMTLSPIFDSISKTGYMATAFDKERLPGILSHRRVVALGGVTPDKFSVLAQSGFIGGAMLGYIWTNSGRKNFRKIVETLKDY